MRFGKLDQSDLDLDDLFSRSLTGNFKYRSLLFLVSRIFKHRPPHWMLWDFSAMCALLGGSTSLLTDEQDE